MASPFAYLASRTRRAMKNADDAALRDVEHGYAPRENFSSLVHTYFEVECKQVVRELQFMKVMKEHIQNDLEEIMGVEQAPSSYFISIRPDDTKTAFDDFRQKILEFVTRKCFLSYALSFEQKGVLPSELGKGFHCHIVAKMRQRSKGEVLRDLKSTFKTWLDDDRLAPNCIDVKVTKNPEQLVQTYLVDYKSDDEHKEITKGMDDLWRREMGIPPLYTSDRLSSPDGDL